MGKKKKLKQKTNKPARNIASEIKNLLGTTGRNLTLKQITKKLQLKKKADIKRAGEIIDELEATSTVERSDDGAYKEGRSAASLTGVVDHVSGRFAYIRVDDGEDDVYVKARDLGGAVHGDTVQLRILSTRHGEHREGRITEVVKRNRTRFVGKVEKQKNYAYVVPDIKKIHTDFFVYPEQIKGTESGEK
jgi:exoribonuclease R